MKDCLDLIESVGFQPIMVSEIFRSDNIRIQWIVYLESSAVWLD